jgi:prepilin-type N-terminal cleavage/methylation domain-containing protein
MVIPASKRLAPSGLTLDAGCLARVNYTGHVTGFSNHFTIGFSTDHSSMGFNRTSTFPARSAPPRAFTLIELLVVITILGLLVALLLPALSKAKTEATLTACAARLKGIGGTLIIYSNDYRGYYPYRGLNSINVDTQYRMEYIKMGAVDDRDLYRPYIPIKTMQCPFSTAKTYDIDKVSATDGYLSYVIYAGLRMRYNNPAMDFLRVNDEPRCPSPLAAPTTNRRVRVLASDTDEVFRPGVASPFYSRIVSHADRPMLMPQYDLFNASFFFTFYFVSSDTRGLIDKNQVRDDGSVTTCRDVTMNDPRYVEVDSMARHSNPAALAIARGTTFILSDN